MKPSRSSLALLLLKLGVAQGQAVRVWAIDERLLRVHQPPVSVPPACNRYEWGYLASALEIERRDEAFFVFLPCVSKETSAAFLQGLVATDPQSMQVVIQDQAGLHIEAGEPDVPENVRQ